MPFSFLGDMWVPWRVFSKWLPSYFGFKFNHQIPASPPGFQNCISKEALMCTMRLQIKTNGFARSDPCFLQPPWFNKASAFNSSEVSSNPGSDLRCKIPAGSTRVFPNIGVVLPKWMVYNGKPHSNGWFGGTTIFGNTHQNVLLLYCFFISLMHAIPRISWNDFPVKNLSFFFAIFEGKIQNLMLDFIISPSMRFSTETAEVMDICGAGGTTSSDSQLLKLFFCPWKNGAARPKKERKLFIFPKKKQKNPEHMFRCYN